MKVTTNKDENCDSTPARGDKYAMNIFDAEANACAYFYALSCTLW